MKFLHMGNVVIVAFDKQQLGFLQFLNRRYFGKCHRMSAHRESGKLLGFCKCFMGTDGLFKLRFQNKYKFIMLSCFLPLALYLAIDLQINEVLFSQVFSERIIFHLLMILIL